MVFKNNVPQPGDILSTQSQPDLLGNMSQLDTSFGQDHVPFSDLTADNGFHKKVSLLNLATPGGLPGATVKGILYTNSVSSVNQAFFYNGTNNFQITPCLPMRAYANFAGRNSPGVVVPNTSFNVTSINRGALVGQYTVAFTTAMPSANYVVSVIGTTPTLGICVASPAAGAYTTASIVLFFGQLGASAIDPTQASFIIYGG